MSCDRGTRVGQWESVVEQGEAVGGLLRLDGGARLLDACFFSSRNIELFYGESFLQTVFNQQQPIAVAVARFSADGWRLPVRGCAMYLPPTVDP